MADNKVTITYGTVYDGKGAKTAQADLKKTTEQAKKAGEAAAEAGEQGNTGFSNMALGIGKAVAAFAAIKGVIDFFASSIKAYTENARAVNTLAAAYRAVGYTAQGAMKQAQDFASKMQSMTGIADEAFLNAQRLLANYGVVGTKAQEAVQAAYALSIGRGMEFGAAMDVVAKAAAGQTATLARYGIQIDKNTESGAKFDAVLAQINERFGATAQAAMGDMTTQVNALKEEWGDFKELIGESLIPAMRKLIEYGRTAVGAMRVLAGDNGKTVFNDAMENTLKEISKTQREIAHYQYIINNGRKSEIAFAEKGLAKAQSHLTLLEGRKKVLMDGNDEYVKSQFFAKQELKANEEVVNKKREKVALVKEELDTEQKISDEEEKRRVNGVLNNAGVGPKQTTAGWNTDSDVSAKFLGMSEIVAGAEINETQRFLQEIEERKKGLEDLYKKKLELLEQGHLDEQTFTDAKKELDLQYAEQTVALEMQVAARRQKTMATTLNNLASLQSSSNKKMAAVGKTAAIAQATIDTYKSAVAAYSAMAGIPVVGPALAVAAAAAAIAAGLNNVAQISNVQLAEGGLVKAVTGGVPAVIGEGGSDEAVLPLDDSQAMRRIGGAIAEESGGTMGGVVVNINVQATGGVEAILEQLTDAARTGTVQALEFANINYKTGQEQQGYSV